MLYRQVSLWGFVCYNHRYTVGIYKMACKKIYADCVCQMEAILFQQCVL